MPIPPRFGFEPPDYEDCGEKCRCLNGPNKGTPYAKKKPCRETFEFVPESCECKALVRADGMIQVRVKSFASRAIEFLDRSQGALGNPSNNHPASQYGGWNKDTDPCPWLNALTPDALSLKDSRGGKFSYIPWFEPGNIMVPNRESRYAYYSTCLDCEDQFDVPISNCAGPEDDRNANYVKINMYDGKNVNFFCEGVNDNGLNVILGSADGDNCKVGSTPWPNYTGVTKTRLYSAFQDTTPDQASLGMHQNYFYSIDSAGVLAQADTGNRPAVPGTPTNKCMLIDYFNAGLVAFTTYRPELGGYYKPVVGQPWQQQHPIGTDYSMELEWRYRTSGMPDVPPGDPGYDQSWIYPEPGEAPRSNSIDYPYDV